MLQSNVMNHPDSGIPLPSPSFPQAVGGNPEHRHPRAMGHLSHTVQGKAILPHIKTFSIATSLGAISSEPCYIIILARPLKTFNLST